MEQANKPTREEIENKFINLKNQVDAIKKEMDATKAQLVDLMIAEPTTEFTGVTVYKIMGRKTVGWKTIAEQFKPSRQLIDENTTYGKDSYGVKIVKKDDED